MITGKSIMKKNKATSAQKIQSSVEEYTYFVLEGLIGNKGTSKSDVVSYIIKSWIDTNIQLLKEYDLSFKDFKKAKNN